MYPGHRLPEVYFKDPKGYKWAFSVAIMNIESIKQLTSLSGLSESSAVALLWADEEQALIATMTVHAPVYQQQYCSSRDSLAPTCGLIHPLETQRAISIFQMCHMAHAKVWWRVKVNRDYCVLNEDVMLLLCAVVLDMLEPLCQLESRTDKRCATTDTINVFLLHSFGSRSNSLLSCEGVSVHLE